MKFIFSKILVLVFAAFTTIAQAASTCSDYHVSSVETWVDDYDVGFKAELERFQSLCAYKVTLGRDLGAVQRLKNELEQKLYSLKTHQRSFSEIRSFGMEVVGDLNKIARSCSGTHRSYAARTSKEMKQIVKDRHREIMKDINRCQKNIGNSIAEIDEFIADIKLEETKKRQNRETKKVPKVSNPVNDSETNQVPIDGFYLSIKIDSCRRSAAHSYDYGNRIGEGVSWGDINLKKGLVDCKAALGLDKNNAMLYTILSRLYNKQGNYDLSMRYAEKSIALGDPFGFVMKGFHYEHGDGVVKDTGKALEFYKTAYKNGAKGAAMLIANAYRYGVLGLPQDDLFADHWEIQAKGMQRQKKVEKSVDNKSVSSTDDGNCKVVADYVKCGQKVFKYPNNAKGTHHEKEVISLFKIIYDKELERLDGPPSKSAYSHDYNDYFIPDSNGR